MEEKAQSPRELEATRSTHVLESQKKRRERGRNNIRRSYG